MKTRLKLLAPFAALMLTAGPLSASIYTTGPFALNYTNLTTGTVSPFQLPRFNSALGTLRSVDISFNFYGTVAGTATGVNQSDSIDSTVTHWVFFNFEDNSDNFGIAEPDLALTAGIPGGAQNATISFGPQSRSITDTFSAGPGDLRFADWQNGPGTINGTLDVYFENTTPSWNDTTAFFPGTDSGLYNGSLSISYNYAPVPEPSACALMLIGLLLMIPMRRIAQRCPGSAGVPPASVSTG